VADLAGRGGAYRWRRRHLVVTPTVTDLQWFAFVILPIALADTAFVRENAATPRKKE